MTDTEQTLSPLAKVGAERQEHRAAARFATEALRRLVLEALAAGQSEASVAREGRVDRVTVRKWKHESSPTL